MRAPLMTSCLFAALDSWWPFPSVHGKFNIGPLTWVISVAPPIVTMVPNTFARPRHLLIFTFSRLQKHSQIFEAPHIYYIMYICMQCANVNETKDNYPKIQAIENVNAGTTLHMALAKVAEVYFVPVKNRFWLITGLSRGKWKLKRGPTEPKKKKKRAKA